MVHLWITGRLPLAVSQVVLLITCIVVNSRWDFFKDYNGFAPEISVVMASFGTLASIVMTATQCSCDYSLPGLSDQTVEGQT
ncbi:hypothetical protein F5Y17DRAFT_458457 [Xylariaceae sp. FL0594]|nr:hypothetical protein F5Y17DRAFT_458457 [Xylariaceae sp. FL0594]